MSLDPAGKSACATIGCMPENRWFWATLTLSSITIVSVGLAACGWGVEWVPAPAGKSACATIGCMPENRWFWATLTLSSITIVSVVLAAWELVENRLFRDADYITLHYLYITRGVASSLLLAFWAAWFVLRQRRKSEADLRRSRDLYRAERR